MVRIVKVLTASALKKLRQIKVRREKFAGCYDSLTWDTYARFNSKLTIKSYAWGEEIEWTCTEDRYLGCRESW